MTSVTPSDISQSTQAAWKAVFGIPLREIAAVDPIKKGDKILLSRVRILSDVSRSIVVICPLDRAREIAGGFFGKDPGDIETNLVHDVFGEIANMIGGLIKRHFPQSTRLSLPEVVETEQSNSTELLSQAVFVCQTGGALSVRFLQHHS